MVNLMPNLNLLKKPDTVSVYGVVEGPFHCSDLEDDDWCFKEDFWILALLVENEYGALVCEEFEFDTFDDAYEIVSHFKEKHKPFIMELEDE